MEHSAIITKIEFSLGTYRIVRHSLRGSAVCDNQYREEKNFIQKMCRGEMRGLKMPKRCLDGYLAALKAAIK